MFFVLHLHNAKTLISIPRGKDMSMHPFAMLMRRSAMPMHPFAMLMRRSAMPIHPFVMLMR